HLRENEIAGAVDNDGQPLDMVGGQAFTQHLDNRDTAGYRRLERHHRAGPDGGGKNAVAMNSQQMLVGGDDMLAVFDGGHDQVISLGIAADQLQYDIHIRVFDHITRPVGQADVADIAIAFSIEVAYCGMGDTNTAPGAAGNFVAV